MAPTSFNATQTDLSSELEDIVPCVGCSTSSNCAFVVVFFMLVFYALALWDRWLQLKMREQQKLRSTSTIQNYGSVRTPVIRKTSPSPQRGKVQAEKETGLLTIPSPNPASKPYGPPL